MSAYSQNVKTKFGGFFKSLFGKGGEVETSTVATEELHTPVTIASSKRPTAPVQAPAYSPNQNGNGHDQADRDDFSFSHSFGNGHAKTNGNDEGNSVDVSLQAIICTMPPELRNRVRQAVSNELRIPVALDKIVSQLAQGAVKIPFGDVRKAAPHIFAASTDADQLLLTLPLSEILPHINPGMLVRRPAQKPAQISDEITSPFALGAQGLVISPEKPAAKAPVAVTPPPVTAPRRPVAPPAAPPTPPVSVPPTFQRQTAPPPVAPPAPPASVPPTFQRQTAPVPANVPSPFQRTQPTPPPPVARQSMTSAPTPPMSSAPAIPFSRPAPAPAPAAMVPSAPIPMSPITPSAPAVPITPIAPMVPKPVIVQTPAPAPVAPAPVVAPAPAAAPINEAPPLVVPLGALTVNWPETIKQEVARLNLAEAQIALPITLIENGLKRGRLAFPWKTLQSWIRPAPLPSVSINDAMELELPLQVIAPLFISRRKTAAAKAPSKVAVDESIPNLFFGFPQPEAVAPAPAPAAPPAPTAPEPAAESIVTAEAVVPAAKPTETNYFLLEDNAGAQPQAEEFKLPVANATDFTSRKASPEEIIKKAAALEGVVGALIALPDGLKVASSIPAEHNGDALAAFLPQLFNKMSQCTRELRMGELNNLNFTVGNVPWKVFRVNAVFFAAFGRPGQPLPTAQLVALAGELDRKNKQ